IGCGSTTIKGSTIIHVGSDVLKEKIKWAKSCFAKNSREAKSFSNKIELRACRWSGRRHGCWRSDSKG
ncbi:hypothetical protein NL526_27380, partial [Klebsiella pneumoniae]|nr:hypothetical protein [Klebsiella pneumoniae]